MRPHLRTTLETGGLRTPVIEAARRLLRTVGYEHLSMRRVAQEAGCSTMALYRHFANKEALDATLMRGALYHLYRADAPPDGNR